VSRGDGRRSTTHWGDGPPSGALAPRTDRAGENTRVGTSTRLLLETPVARLEMHGDYDLAACGDLQRRLSDADRFGCRELLLDAQAVTFMDCSVLGVLVAVRENLACTGGRLAITVASPQVVRVCHLGGCEHLLGE